MIEHKQLLALAESEDDQPVALLLVKRGLAVNWRDSLPEEVLYIPETIFESAAKDFIKSIGLSGYYDGFSLDQSHINLLIGNLQKPSSSESEQFARQEMNKFIEHGLGLAASHHLFFDGP